MAAASSWKEKLAGDMPPLWAEQIDEFEAQIRAAQGGQDRREGLRRDAPPPRRVRPALRQRPAPRRHRARRQLPYPDADQGPRDVLGRPGHAAHQDPVRRDEPRADDRAGGAGGGVFRRHLPHHHAAGHSAPLRPHRRRPGHLPPAGGGRDHDARGVRQLRPQRHRLPAGGRVQHRIVRRHAVREGDRVLPARPSRHAGFRPQVQDRVLRLPRRGVRAGAACTTWAASPTIKDGKTRVRAVRRRRAGCGAAPGEAADGVLPGGRAAADGPRDRARLRAAGREEEPQQAPG